MSAGHHAGHWRVRSPQEWAGLSSSPISAPSVADFCRCLLAYLRRSGPGELPTDRLLDLVVVDSRRGQYPNGLDAAAIERLGVPVLDVPLVSARSAPLIDPRRVVEALLSLI